MQPDPGSMHASGIDDGRFTAGTVLSERYRIVGRIGRGGMGEVYRADDLKLGQSVALKFLPESMATDAAWLRRLHDEVRVAREIAHPNICRVYDIGEVDGHHFITMEYIDGEDLSSLLRRIGRLPGDKATQIARQMCAGIAAAHERGVLHRDLKPANIMLDGRGDVRITDFGVAALAEQMTGKDARAGTPAYMAPEQLAGKHFTRRSDIYSLGLVLYEVYTGREAFHADSVAKLQRMRESGPPTTPSSYVDDMDPLVERVIMRCLENEPQDRPGSAIAVAAALPGGDPLAAALAAGETPSPEMIAEAGEKGGLKAVVAVPCLLATVVAVVVFMVISAVHALPGKVPFEKSPAVLADRAREIARGLGYTDRPADAGWLFNVDGGYLAHLKKTDPSPDRWAALASGRPSAVNFGYRSSPEPMVARKGQVRRNDPPFTVPGMIRLRVDTDGRLTYFDAVAPSQTDEASPATPDWSDLFNYAGIDQDTLTPATPTWTPDVYCDTRAAWTGPWPGAPEVAMRVEAGAVAGRPVRFELIGPWDKPRTAGLDIETSDFVRWATFFALFMIIPIACGALAWRNMRAGRGDRKGAARLAIYVFVVNMGAWLFGAHHVFSLREWGLITPAFGGAVGAAVVCWLMYLALEPYARRHWPQAMVSWTRLLSGRFRDPLVGRDILLGCVAATAICVIVGVTIAMSDPTPGFAALALFNGGRHVIAHIFDLQTTIAMWLGMFVLLLLLRIGLRHPWLANAVFFAMLLTVISDFFTHEPLVLIADGVSSAIVVLMLFRLGLLSLVTFGMVIPLLLSFPATLDFTRWYAGIGIIGPLLIVALAGWGFWVALAGRPIFRDTLSEA